jgi:hypothetical protein
MAAKNKIRCNMYLNKKNVESVKRFIEGTGLNLSSYVDLLIGKAAENIEIFKNEIGGTLLDESDGEKYFDIYTAYKILGIFDMSMSVSVPITGDMLKLIKDGKIKIGPEKDREIKKSEK